MIIDLSCYPTQVVDTAWRHDGDPFTGERLAAVPAIRPKMSPHANGIPIQNTRRSNAVMNGRND